MKKFIELNKTILAISVLAFIISFAAAFMKEYNRIDTEDTDSFVVEIQSIDLSSFSGRSRSTGATFNNLEISTSFNFSDRHEEVIYRVKVINSGTDNAILRKINIVELTDYTDYEISGTIIGSKLNAGSSNTFYIVFKSNDEGIYPANGNATINFEYEPYK